MIDRIFWACVGLLHWAAKKCRITYEAINVWIFCVIWPLFTLALIAVVLWQGALIARMHH